MATASFSKSATITPIRIEGAKEMAALLKKLPDEIAKRTLTNALRKGAQVVLAEAQRRAPVGKESKGRVRLYRRKSGSVRISNYGKLKLNLRTVTIPRSELSPGAAAGVAVSVGKAFWGMFLEFGTRFMSAKQFMRPAFDATHRQALRIVGQELGKGIEKAAKKLAGPRAKPSRRR